MYYKINLNNWHDKTFSDYILRQYNSEFKNLETDGDIKAYRHAPKWKDFGYISSPEISKYMKRLSSIDLSIFQYKTILINDPNTFADRHIENDNKCTSLLIPLVGEFDKAITEWWIEDAKTSFAAFTIKTPTLIDTTYPHSITYTGSIPRIMLALRSSINIQEMARIFVG